MGKLCNMVCFIHNKKKTGCMLRCSQYTAGLLLLCPCFLTSLHSVSVLVFFCEYFFSHTTDRAEPVVRQIFKSCSGSDTSVRISIFRIINIATRLTYIFFHLFSSVRNLSCPCPGYFPKHHLIVIAYIISDKNAISL